MEDKINTGILDCMELLHVKASKQGFPVHYHETYCLSLVHSGFLGENDFIASAGSLLISHPFEVHYNHLINEVNYSLTTFYISSDLFQSLFRSTHLSFPDKIIDNPGLFASFLRLSFQVPNQQTVTNNKTFETDFTHLLKKLLYEYASPQPFIGEEKNYAPITLIKQFIIENIDKKIDLNSLAKIADKDRYQFIRWFKKQVGLTPMHFVMLQRVERAKKMLKEGKPLVHVALDTGFYDQSHFSNYFKHFVGVCPGDYQQQCNILQ